MPTILCSPFLKIAALGQITIIKVLIKLGVVSRKLLMSNTTCQSVQRAVDFNAAIRTLQNAEESNSKSMNLKVAIWLVVMASNG